jgi:threonine dehydratase
MRCVAGLATAARGRWATPEPAALEAVRHLDARFPQARLREVPLVRAAELDARADPGGGTRVWLALEALQVTGTFKVRGALVALEANRSRGGAVAAGAGNHGVAVAYAARVLGMPATVCVPRTATGTRRAKIERYGAELVIAPSDERRDVEELAMGIARAQQSAFIPHCDDLDVVVGNGASLGFEIVRGLGGIPERVLAPAGGGLATGLSWALSVEGRGRVQPAVWAVESETRCSATPGAASGDGRAPAFALSDGGGTAGTGARVRTAADRSGAHRTSQGLATALAVVAGMVVVGDDQIAAAMAYAYADMGLVVEGSAGAALAPVLCGLPEAIRGGGDLVVVLPGRNVDPERLAEVLRRIGEATPA